MNGRSIRFRLTAWYAAVTLVTLVAAAMTVIALVDHSVTRAADDRLAAHHQGLARFANGLEAGLSPVEIRDEYREYADVSLGNALFSLTTAGGQVLAHPDVNGWDEALAPLVEAAARGVSAEADVLLSGQPYRASTRPMTIGAAPARAVIAVPMGPARDALARADRLLLWLLPLFAVAASIGGYLISARALRPVDRLTSAAREIDVDHLDRRLDVPPARDEVQRLAVTFNGMLDRLQSGVAEMARFSAEASHELRTPVTRIRTAAELALRRERTPDEYRATLTDIHAQSREMSALVDDLLTVARADSGRDTSPAERVDIAEVAAGIAREWAGAPTIVCRAAAPLTVRGDQRQLARVLTIVCENAAKYGPDGAPITISGQVSGGHVVIDIDDDGPGIPAEDLPRVFERFYRGRKARAGAVAGSGLGLAIAKGLVERHGGTIAVRSPLRDSARPGTRVTITLPSFGA